MRARVERGQTVVRAVLLVAAVLVIGVLLYRQLSRFTTERVPVWVSAADLKAGQVVTGGVMKRVEMPAPKGAFVDPAAVQGRTLKVAKPAGQPFYPADLEPRPVPPALASTIPAGRLLATVRVAAFDLPTDDLRGGDRLDIIKSGSGGTEMVAHDAYMMGNLRSTPAQGESNRLLGIDLTPPDQKKANAAAEALVLAVFPEDVFPLAAAEASGQRLKIVLHSDVEVKSGILLTPDPPKPEPEGNGLPAVEVIRGKTKETVYAADEVRRITYAPPAAQSSPKPRPAPTTGGSQ